MISFKISKLFSAKGTVNRLREHLRFIHGFKLPLYLEVLFPVKMSYVQTDATTSNNVETYSAIVRRIQPI